MCCAGRPPLPGQLGVSRKPRRLSFGADGDPLQPDERPPPPPPAAAAAPGPGGRASEGSQRSGSESLVELDGTSEIPEGADLSGIPEELIRQSLSGAIPVSIRALLVRLNPTFKALLSRLS